MKQIMIDINKVSCDKSKYNEVEVDFWKRRFLEKKPIPSPWINDRKEVIAFYNCFFVDKELQIPEICVVLASEK